MIIVDIEKEVDDDHYSDNESIVSDTSLVIS